MGFGYVQHAQVELLGLRIGALGECVALLLDDVEGRVHSIVQLQLPFHFAGGQEQRRILQQIKPRHINYLEATLVESNVLNVTTWPFVITDFELIILYKWEKDAIVQGTSPSFRRMQHIQTHKSTVVVPKGSGSKIPYFVTYFMLFKCRAFLLGAEEVNWEAGCRARAFSLGAEEATGKQDAEPVLH